MSDLDNAIALIKKHGMSVTRGEPFPTDAEKRLPIIRSAIESRTLGESSAYSHLMWCLHYIDHLHEDRAWQQGG